MAFPGRPHLWQLRFLLLLAAICAGEEERAGPAAILILGQSLRPDGTAPGTLIQRAEKAAELYHLYPESPAAAVVPSGGDPAGVGVTEATVMRQLLLRHGVSDSDIHMESQALTTVENVLYAIPILRSLRSARVTVVTSDFHMPRASLIVEAILQNQTEPDEFALTLVHSVGGCPEKDAPPGVDINEESLVQRLRREVQNVRGKFHEQFFTSKDLDIRIPIPSGDRMRHALYELSVQLAAATAAVPSSTQRPALRGSEEEPLKSRVMIKFIVAAIACGLLGVLLGCAVRGPFKNKVPYIPVEEAQAHHPPLPSPLPATVGKLATMRRQNS